MESNDNPTESTTDPISSPSGGDGRTVDPGGLPADSYPGATRLRPARRRWVAPLVLFVLTCGSTYLVGGAGYAASLMLVLLCHEFGHFLQALRHRVPASLPFFIPMPLSPVGTMGAIIGMQPGVADRKKLFDIAVTGPLAGLLPALVFSVIGLRLSKVVDTSELSQAIYLGDPLLFRFLGWLIVGPLAENQDILLHPVGFAGWFGILITALNLIPIGQLDGGHVLYALIGRRAHRVAIVLLLGAVAAMVLSGQFDWLLMVFLLFLIGWKHPPTSDDTVPLGLGRMLLGWLVLLFIPLGFTPIPMVVQLN